MKTFFMLFPVMALFSFSALAQQAEGPLFEVVPTEVAFAERYEGGEQAFLQPIYQKVQYPLEARMNCITGKLITRIDINSLGELKKIEFLNKIPLGAGIEDEVVNMIMLTKENWTPGKKGMSTHISFVFKIGEVDDIEGTVMITAMSAAGNPELSCTEPRKKLLNELEKLEKRKKRKQALVICEELLRRYPEDETLVERWMQLSEKKG